MSQLHVQLDPVACRRHEESDSRDADAEGDRTNELAVCSRICDVHAPQKDTPPSALDSGTEVEVLFRALHRDVVHLPVFAAVEVKLRAADKAETGGQGSLKLRADAAGPRSQIRRVYAVAAVVHRLQLHCR